MASRLGYRHHMSSASFWWLNYKVTCKGSVRIFFGKTAFNSVFRVMFLVVEASKVASFFHDLTLDCNLVGLGILI